MKTSIDDDLLRAFEQALARDQLYMAYQPTIALADGSLSRVEALVRWDDSEMGKVEPSRFVALAEDNGWIDELTIWGLGAILQQWRTWRESGIDTHIAFNISAISLQRLDFPDLVERLCRSLGVPTNRIMLELTEGATQPLIKLMDTLTRFRIKGIGLAIDDFGTGYSSLLQLRRLPFTEVKIDRAFVGDVEKSKDSALIVKTIIDLAQGLGLSATAEGVENAAQLTTLRAMGCDLAQGYLIAAPLAPDQLAGWIEEFKHRWPALANSPRSAAAEIEANALSQG
ncbi:MAG: EAL domain-containing protein [Sphingomonas sp.]|nr:EAL domain-containing protein [Sphingomonas sp.]